MCLYILDLHFILREKQKCFVFLGLLLYSLCTSDAPPRERGLLGYLLGAMGTFLSLLSFRACLLEDPLAPCVSSSCLPSLAPSYTAGEVAREPEAQQAVWFSFHQISLTVRFLFKYETQHELLH